MTLKSIEMQIAIPRTNEAAVLQQQLLHKPMTDQELLAQQTLRAMEEQRQISPKTESAYQAAIEHELRRPTHSRQGEKSKKARSKPANETNAQHPYKGVHVDLSL